MSDLSFELTAQPRADVGKGASRRLRRLEDRVPAVVYGGKSKPTNLMFEHREVIKALESEAFYSHIITLKVGGKSEKVVLKDVQRHPFKPRIQHLDFQRVSARDHLVMHVPLHFEGEEACAGVKDGGILNRQMTDVEVRCLPANLPEFLSVDISGLALDGVLHLSDIPLPKGVELTAFSHGDVHEHDLPVISVHEPKRVEEEPAPAPEADEESGSDSASASETPSGDEG